LNQKKRKRVKGGTLGTEPGEYILMAKGGKSRKGKSREGVRHEVLIGPTQSMKNVVD